MADLVITIDGPAASGKSTAARLLAEKLDARFLDTGAMYRAVTLAAMQKGVDLTDQQQLLDILKSSKFKFKPKDGQTVVSIDGKDVTEEIRSADVTANARYIASAAKLREKLVKMQRQFAADEKRIVTEGRDQGTVAFSDADLKIFLIADVVERASRRFAELQAKGQPADLEEIKKAIEERDLSDQTRAVSPLKPADDAISVDTSNLSIEQVVEKLMNYAKPILEDEPKRLWFAVARWICKVFCQLFFRIRVYGMENIPRRGGFLIISNHQSFLDPILAGIFIKRHMHFLARDTLFRNKFLGSIIASVNTIPVRRGEADLGAMKAIIAKLKANCGVCLFPEGTRSIDGKISVFKPGFGLLCRRGHAAVVPTVIDGAFEAWPKNKKFFSAGAKITISYGKCITAEQIKSISDRELAEKLTGTLRKMQNDIRIKSGKEPYNYG